MEPGIPSLLYFLVFRPARFAEIAARYADELNRQERERDEARHAGKEPVDREPFLLRQTREVRHAFGQSALMVAGVIVAGCLTGLTLQAVFGPPQQLIARLILYTGIGTLLWATLGKGGWSIRTFGGVSLPERVDEYIYRVLHLSGSFLLVISGTWQASYWS